MIEINLREGEDFIKLGQLLKKAGLVDSGSDAKFVIEEGEVSVNGSIDTCRGRKIHVGDKVSFDGEEILIIP